MSRPDLIIFDCDGVLVDTETVGNRALSKWLTGAGFPITFEACRARFMGRSMRSVQEVVEAHGVVLGDDFVDRWNASLPALFADGVEPIAHIRETLDLIRALGVPHCVASSARISKMHITLGATGLLRHFEGRLFSATMVPRGKPFPDLFLHAAGAMGHQPSRCIVVEDSVAGTEAGTAAGMRVFSYCGNALADRTGLKSAGGILFDDMRDLPRLAGIA